MTGLPECLDWGKDKKHLSLFFSLWVEWEVEKWPRQVSRDAWWEGKAAVSGWWLGDHSWEGTLERDCHVHHLAHVTLKTDFQTLIPSSWMTLFMLQEPLGSHQESQPTVQEGLYKLLESCNFAKFKTHTTIKAGVGGDMYPLLFSKLHQGSGWELFRHTASRFLLSGGPYK